MAGLSASADLAWGSGRLGVIPALVFLVYVEITQRNHVRIDMVRPEAPTVGPPSFSTFLQRFFCLWVDVRAYPRNGNTRKSPCLVRGWGLGTPKSLQLTLNPKP